ncbi:MAG: class I SAM-dependent methyltransferase [Xanthobacteraceae bacterium]
MTAPINRRIVVCGLTAMFAVCFAAAVSAQGVPDYAEIVAAPDRIEADRIIDQRRDPVNLLAFIGVRRGMKVLDMGAGGGYSTELLARAVGPTGIVYGQNGPDVSARAKERFNLRLSTPAMLRVSPLEQPFDDPLPPGLDQFDLITFLFYYHDTTYTPVDRAAMNRKIYDALKPGGVLVVADHSAKDGEGTSVAKTLHRIEESVVRREIEAAGFKLIGEADFLRRPEDTRDFSVNRPTGPVDEFVLKFQKPK